VTRRHSAGIVADVPTDPLERDVLAIGRRIAGALPPRGHRPLRALDDKAMDWASQDADLRAALFRFVDVVPACRSLDDLAQHLAGFLDAVGERPPPLQVAMRMSETKAGRAALGAAAAAGVRHMAHRFIVGADPDAAGPVLRRLWNDGVATSVDLLGEATVTAAEADRYAARCHAALGSLASMHAPLARRPLLESDSSGPLPRANLSVKVSALTPLLRADAPELGMRDAAVRLRELLRRALAVDAHVHIDMESFDSRESVFALVLELLSEPKFRAGPSAGVVLQAYLRESPQQLDTILAWAAATPRSRPLVVRLVKGAYWDHEVIEARRHGWQAPVFEVKAESDRTFEALTRRLLEARPLVRPAIASHNLRSVAHAVAVNRSLGAPDGDLELQVLRGLGDDLQEALAAVGQRVRVYCPVGDLVSGMAYLVRRLLENTSNESCLHDQATGVPLEQLLAAP
jgi:RHH-type proline utilization regulon transcriptional repressor/proline dehydrogenase/delta 1-pyrroline-5-carboxylate dehydrogenase